MTVPSNTSPASENAEYRTHSKAKAYTILATHRSRQESQSQGHAGILLILVRLKEQKTDLIVTINLPQIATQEELREIDLPVGVWGKQLDAALVYQTRVLETLDIRDWNLFV